MSRIQYMPGHVLNIENDVSVFVLLKFGFDARLYEERYMKGLEPDRTPYGFHFGERPGWRITFSVDKEENAFSAVVRRAFAHLLGFDLIHAFRNRRAIVESDIVWTMAEREWLAVAALWSLRLIAVKPIVGNSVWLFNKWKTFSIIRRYIYKTLAKKCSILTVHSANSLPIGRNILSESHLELQYFGVSTETFPLKAPAPPTAPRGKIRLVATGNDRTRDWETLLLAFGNDDRFDITLVCWWAPQSYLERFRNLRIMRSISPHGFSEIYDNCDFVVIPMFNNIFSGITVMLEAVAVGKPVICSFTGGCPTYFDADEVTFVPCGDPEALRRAALNTDPETAYKRARKAQQRFVREDYSTRGMMDRYVEISKRILGHADQTANAVNA